MNAIRPLHCLTLALLAAVSIASAHGHGHGSAQHAHAPEQAPPPIPQAVPIPLDAPALAGLQRHAVSASVHRTTLHCEGVALIDLLRAAGTIPEGALRSRHLARYVLVEARDGYRAVFSLAELDPGTGNRAVYLVDRCAGTALDDADGPLRLLVPDDVRAARSVRQVDAITVAVAP